MNKEELKSFRKEMIAKLEEKLGTSQNPEEDTLPMILKSAYNFSIDKDARRLGAICVVAGGYGGDMKEDKAN